MRFGELLHRMVSPVAALLRDGLVLAAAQEERFTRREHDSNFPHHAIRSRLESMGTRPSFQRKEQQNPALRQN